MKMTVEFNSANEIKDFLRYLDLKEEFHEFIASKNTKVCDKTPLSKCDLTARTTHCLADEGIHYLEDALLMSDMDLLKIPNFGKRSLYELRNYKNDNSPV